MLRTEEIRKTTPSPIKRLRRRFLAISLAEATFARRGFREKDAPSRQHLEQIGQTFLSGYQAALEEDDLNDLAQRLASLVPLAFQGFAFEGAAMGLALLDLFAFWRPGRLPAFFNGPGADHIYMIHVGAGWLLARLRRPVKQPPGQLDPLLGWLAVDGYGFHEGYFRWPRTIKKQMIPGRLSGYARRVFDQGLGRSLWFVEGADSARIPEAIARFAPSRRADLWSGVGLACAYAGGADHTAVAKLKATAVPFTPHLAQGAAFAAKARQRAGNMTAHTELACEILCGVPARQAAHITDKALDGLPPDSTEPAYEIWRRRIRRYLAGCL